MKVKDTVKEGVLKVLKITCDSNLYDEVTEIGARIQVRWSGDELKGTGWKSGWYAAEVQGFDPDEDTISKCLTCLLVQSRQSLVHAISTEL